MKVDRAAVDLHLYIQTGVVIGQRSKPQLPFIVEFAAVAKVDLNCGRAERWNALPNSVVGPKRSQDQCSAP